MLKKICIATWRARAGNDRNVIFFAQRVQESVLSRWPNDAHRMDKRILSLIVLAHASDVLENAFAPLGDEDYEVAMKRVRSLLELDFEAECAKSSDGPHHLVWAVFESFNK